MSQEITEIKEELHKVLPDNSPVLVFVDNIYTIILICILAVTVLNYIKSAKLTLRNIGAKIDFKDLKKKKDISNKLNEILAITGADRVILGYFHNGTQIGNMKTLKMTVPDIFEVTSDRAKKISKQIKDIELENILDEITKLEKEPFGQLKINKNDNLSSGCKVYLDRVGIEEKHVYLMQNRKGILEIHFMSLDHYEWNKELLQGKIDALNYLFSRMMK